MNEQLILILGAMALFFLYRKAKSSKVRAQLATLDMSETQLLDVRSESEFAGYNAPGSLNIPLPSLIAGNTRGLDQSKTLLVFCASGMRSGSACVKLKGLGYKVINAGSVGTVIQHINR